QRGHRVGQLDVDHRRSETRQDLHRGLDDQEHFRLDEREARRASGELPISRRPDTRQRAGAVARDPPLAAATTSATRAGTKKTPIDNIARTTPTDISTTATI